MVIKKNTMSYYLSKIVNQPFDKTVSQLRELLPSQGFGVVTEMDVTQKLKEKLDVDFRPYLILGACNPSFAHMALLEEDKLGTILPCNFMVQKIDDNTTEVAAINPEVAMESIKNPRLTGFAKEVTEMLKQIMDKI